jgi:hypothetical protein
MLSQDAHRREENMGQGIRTGKVIVKPFMAMLLLVVFFSPAWGQGAPGDASGKEKWEFSVAPYFWMSGMSGTMTVKGVEAPADFSFNQLFDHLNMGAQGHLEARKGKWGLFFDGTYLKLSTSNNTVSSRIGPVAGDGKLEETIIELGGLYQLGEWALGEGKEPNTRVDLLGGARYWNIYGSVNVAVPAVALFIDNSGTKQWVDPFIGLRVSAKLSRNLRLMLRGDIGGFGVGSHFTSNGLGAFGYSFSDMITAWAGYRAMAVNYETGSGMNKFRYDVVMYGPIVGVEFRF